MKLTITKKSIRGIRNTLKDIEVIESKVQGFIGYKTPKKTKTKKSKKK